MTGILAAPALAPLVARRAVWRVCRLKLAPWVLLLACGCGHRPGTPYVPDHRLFVCRYGTGLDPNNLIENLPSYVQTIPEIHERYVADFIRSPGFGMERYHWSPSHWVELVPRNLSPSATESNRDRVYPDRSADTNERGARWAGNDRPRYDEHRRTLSGGGVEIDEVRERSWALNDMQLVSLLRPTSPAVYLLKPVRKHAVGRARERRTAFLQRPADDAQTERETGAYTVGDRPAAPLRALDGFEAEALSRLRQGSELVVRTTATEMRVLGAIRAVDGCRECHDCTRGDVLGAFTYSLSDVTGQPNPDREQELPDTEP